MIEKGIIALNAGILRGRKLRIEKVGIREPENWRTGELEN